MCTMAACSSHSARPAASATTRARAASVFFNAPNDSPASLYSCSSSQTSLSVAPGARPHSTSRFASRSDPCGVIRRGPGRIRVAGAQAQVEHERQAMPFGDRPDFVRAVGVERRERQLGRFAGVHVDGALAVAVANDQPAAGARGRQRDRQGGDHAVGLLGVAVGREEPPRFIDQQLVELRVEPVRRAPEAGRRRAEDPGERLRPRSAPQSQPPGIDLPAVANRRVEQRFPAPCR